MSLGNHNAERPAIGYPAKYPLSRHRQAICMPTDFRQPGRLPIAEPRNPCVSGCGLLSPARKAPWALRLPIARDLPFSVSQNSQRFGGQATVRPHNAQDSTLTRGGLSIGRYTAVQALIARFQERFEQSCVFTFPICGCCLHGSYAA